MPATSTGERVARTTRFSSGIEVAATAAEAVTVPDALALDPPPPVRCSGTLGASTASSNAAIAPAATSGFRTRERLLATGELALESAVARHERIPLLGVGIVVSRLEPDTLLGRQEAEPRNLCEGAGLLWGHD